MKISDWKAKSGKWVNGEYTNDPHITGESDDLPECEEENKDGKKDHYLQSGAWMGRW